jgi:hypothetical protein
MSPSKLLNAFETSLFKEVNPHNNKLSHFDFANAAAVGQSIFSIPFNQRYLH